MELFEELPNHEWDLVEDVKADFCTWLEDKHTTKNSINSYCSYIKSIANMANSNCESLKKLNFIEGDITIAELINNNTKEGEFPITICGLVVSILRIISKRDNLLKGLMNQISGFVAFFNYLNWQNGLSIKKSLKNINVKGQWIHDTYNQNYIKKTFINRIKTWDRLTSSKDKDKLFFPIKAILPMFGDEQQGLLKSVYESIRCSLEHPKITQSVLVYSLKI